MAISRLIARFLPAALLGFARRLRFPQLFLLMLALLVINLIVPDFIPLLDELLLALATLALAAWKRRGGDDDQGSAS
ncbi:DUF6116 family protein [Uliginosibacterium sp. H1]|uniref:DUF6116 family protein n=1 Tax=Uliginosibacterium sp. H1 TaxID=3114757 RepID=UPI002E178FAA|nr:DUF6116 family protein [Uliginosibacterium sp. H1]